MKETYLKSLLSRYACLDGLEGEINAVYLLLQQTYKEKKKLLICGNGGSAADSEHMVGELMKSFAKPRNLLNEFQLKLMKVDKQLGQVLGEKLQQTLPAISLTGHPAFSTAYLNDVDGILSFAQQTLGYGEEGDVYFGISTSGNSKNVIYGAVVARAKGMKVVALTGATGGRLAELADKAIIVPEQETYKIQELHLPIYHTLCLMLEEHFFSIRKESK